MASAVLFSSIFKKNYLSEDFDILFGEYKYYLNDIFLDILSDLDKYHEGVKLITDQLMEKEKISGEDLHELIGLIHQVIERIDTQSKQSYIGNN